MTGAEAIVAMFEATIDEREDIVLVSQICKLFCPYLVCEYCIIQQLIMMNKGVDKEHVLVGWLMKMDMIWLESYQPIRCYKTVYVQVKYVIKEPATGAVCYDQSSRKTEIYSLTI